MFFFQIYIKNVWIINMIFLITDMDLGIGMWSDKAERGVDFQDAQ